MNLKITPDRMLPVRTVDEVVMVSRYTGNDLRRLVVTGGGLLSDASHEAVLAALRAGALESIGGDGTVDRVWRPSLRTFSTTNGERRSYTVELLEVEDPVEASAIEIAGETFTPYQYVEEPGSGEVGINIRCRVRTSPDQTDRLFDLILHGDPYLPVVRHGVSDEPRMMRFGRTRYSRHKDDGYDKISLYLLERPHDGASDIRALNLPDDTARAYLAHGLTFLDALVDVLVQKSILTDAEVEEMRTHADAEYKRRILRYDEVTDVDLDEN